MFMYMINNFYKCYYNIRKRKMGWVICFCIKLLIEKDYWVIWYGEDNWKWMVNLSYR